MLVTFLGMVMEVRLVHILNALLSMVVRLSGKVIEVRLWQS